MQIPFKPGLSNKQTSTITKLVEGKSVTTWSNQDKANWAYATNDAPLPTEAARTLFVDLGHSPKFPGANGVKSEVLWNRSIWLRLEKIIDRSKWKVVLVPDSYGWKDLTSNVNLMNRIRYINANCKDGDWVLSIHGNAASNRAVRGVTTCYMGGSEYMRVKAKELSQVYSKITGVPMWGGGTFDDRTGRFKRIGMVRDTKPPALLIEAGFVTNRDDMAVDPAKAAQGIADWFNNL